MSKPSKLIISMCVMVWMVLAIGVCGALDCDTMTVDQAIIYIASRTAVLACVVGITATVDMWHSSIKKARQDGSPNRAKKNYNSRSL